jgi:hypothetical protein
MEVCLSNDYVDFVGIRPELATSWDPVALQKNIHSSSQLMCLQDAIILYSQIKSLG